MKRQDRPSLEEAYACVTGHGDLTPSAQEVLGAAAWTSGPAYQVDVASVLRRLRNAWDIGRPRQRVAVPAAAWRAAGLPRDQAKSRHKRELREFAVTYHREREALKRRIPEYAQALEALMVHAAFECIEEPGPKALAVLDRWLDDAQRVPENIDEARLWSYLRECLNRARAALQQGARGHTKHERDEQ